MSRERLFVTGGIRAEHITRDGVEANVSQFSARPPFPAQTVNSLNPKIAVSYLLTRPEAESSTIKTRIFLGEELFEELGKEAIIVFYLPGAILRLSAF